MAINYKVLGQSNPASLVNVDVYTAPSATSAIVSSITVANLGTSGFYRMAIRPAGAALSNEHYIAFDASLNANDSVTWTLGVTLSSSDVITVSASTDSFAFSVFGSEIS